MIRKIRIFTILFFFLALLFGCKKEFQTKTEMVPKSKKFGEQTYLTKSLDEEENKSDEQWKKEAEKYLKMKEGDTITVYNNESQKYIKQDNTEEENYEPFVDVKPLSEAERKQQLNRKIIKERYYIENPNHTWRRVLKKEYYGY